MKVYILLTAPDCWSMLFDKNLIAHYAGSYNDLCVEASDL